MNVTLGGTNYKLTAEVDRDSGELTTILLHINKQLTIGGAAMRGHVRFCCLVGTGKWEADNDGEDGAAYLSSVLGGDPKYYPKHEDEIVFIRVLQAQFNLWAEDNGAALEQERRRLVAFEFAGEIKHARRIIDADLSRIQSKLSEIAQLRQDILDCEEMIQEYQAMLTALFQTAASKDMESEGADG